MSHYTEDLAAIYESFEAVSNGQYSPAPGHPSYRKGSLPGAYAGSAPRPYEMGLTGNGITSPVEAEETNPVIIKIDDLMKTAHNDEMMYAVHMLGQLKAYVQELVN